MKGPESTCLIGQVYVNNHMTKSKGLHPRNIHNQRYDFDALIESSSGLSEFVFTNQYGDKTIDFSNPNSVLALNSALLSHFYQIESWSIPQGRLCPPIPGRADYIHYLADLLDLTKPQKGLDIGTGTGCIYPIIGASVYGFKFVATDIDSKSIESSRKIINSNPQLKDQIELRLQKSPANIFKNTIQGKEKFDFTICNPPFHSSLKAASKGTERKRKNLIKNKQKKGHDTNQIKEGLNFGGKNAELWCPGGELKFIGNMITESILYQNQIKLFTTLLSKKEHLKKLYQLLKNAGAKDVSTIQMHHGQKVSHILVWKFH